MNQGFDVLEIAQEDMCSFIGIGIGKLLSLREERGPVPLLYVAEETRPRGVQSLMVSC